MGNFLNSTARAAVIAAAAAVIVAAPTPALASDHVVRLRAFVPTQCTVQLQGALTPISADSFSLGNVAQFCNTRSQLTLFHGEAGGAQIGFKNQLIGATGNATVLETAGNPIAGANQLTLYGVDATGAQAFTSALTIAVSPIGF